jgi:outer membrane lipase/esterase
VQLGLYTDENRGKTFGQSFALALRGGADFDLGPVTTGPVAGISLQRIHFGGFTETGISGVTALAYAGQKRDSAVMQLGWRAAFDWGKLHPFASLEWEHEWAGKERRVTASITTASTAPYSIDAAPIASNWATVSAGASYQVSPQLALTGMFSSSVGNPVVDNYGGDLRLALGF